MNLENKNQNRRDFIRKGAMVCGGIMVLPQAHAHAHTDEETSTVEDYYTIGPKKGFSPAIGTMVSMLNVMRKVVLKECKNLSIEDLDFQFDEKANSLGAILLHLAATEMDYQYYFKKYKRFRGDWNDDQEKQLEEAKYLGDGREIIKGNSLEFYLGVMKQVRDYSMEEFAKHDDTWLTETLPEKEWWSGPTNIYFNWFHVCEHESNHNGQIKWLKQRLPSAAGKK